MTALWQRPATELAELIAGRRASAREVIDAHLDRIAAVNGAVNAVTRVLADEARAAADAADAAVARGAPIGPLHGVPFTVKENIDLAGCPTTWGVPALAGAVVPVDAPVVERMRAAGAIAIARTNLPDMALRVTTESSLHGVTRNPWDASRTAGGSSGGEAAALATGMSPMGLGNDIGGSLRNPANACGIASLRPTAGRVPDAGLVPGEDRPLAVQLMNVQGPMARRVADVRRMFTALAGAHPRDPWSVTVAPPPRQAGRLRVAVLAEPPGGPCDPVVSAAVRRAADALSDAGYDVAPVCPPDYEAAIDTWARLLLTDFTPLLERILPLMGEPGRVFLQRALAGVQPSAKAADLSTLLATRDGIARRWSQFFATTPLLLTPVWTQLPFPHGFDAASEDGTQQTISMTRPVSPANLMGLPSACVNAGADPASGLPVGVLLTGWRYTDETCLDAAEVVEDRLAVATPIDPRG